MKKQIFFSWQSDLPNKTNRNFIQRCLERAVSKISKKDFFSVEFNIERDTKNETGTPDIVNTIFKKIDRSSIFIADISIVNGQNAERKTPNPNVLVELGYAAKTLGWDKIICIYNLSFGKIEDLPFDLRFRRPLFYSRSETPEKVENDDLAKLLELAITDIAAKHGVENEILDYVKVKIDNQVLSILKIISKIVFTYSMDQTALSTFPQLLSITDEELKEYLNTNEYIGFQIFKNLDESLKNFERLLESSLILNNLDAGQISVLPKFLRNIIRYQNINDHRFVRDLFIDSGKKSIEYIVKNAYEINPANSKDAHLLLEILEGDRFEVTDFGDFTDSDSVQNLLNVYTLNPKHLQIYFRSIRNFIDIANEWIGKTGDEFVIDNKKFKLNIR